MVAHMKKDLAKMLLWLNITFLVINFLFLLAGTSPTVNFIAALISLAGFAASWHLYNTLEE